MRTTIRILLFVFAVACIASIAASVPGCLRVKTFDVDVDRARTRARHAFGIGWISNTYLYFGDIHSQTDIDYTATVDGEGTELQPPMRPSSTSITDMIALPVPPNTDSAPVAPL
jgi:hypothetical protein